MRRWGLIGAVVLVVAASLRAAAAPVTIKFNYRNVSVGAERLVKAWIAEFEQLHPEIKVEWTVAGSGWEDKLLVEMAAGTAPDVTEFWGAFAQRLAHRGLLLDLRPYVERDFSASEVEDFFPSSWALTFIGYGPRKGEQYALPRYINTTPIYYNADLFARAGLEHPGILNERGEWTWQTLRDSAKKLVRKDGDKVVQYGFALLTNHWHRIAQWVWEAGGDFFDPEDPLVFTADRAEAVEGVQFIHDMIWQDSSTMPSLSGQAFIEGRLGMMSTGLNDALSRFKPAIGDAFAWNMTRRAVGPKGRRPYIVDDAFGIWSGTRHPDEAWEFLKFITSTRGQQLMVEHEGLAPTRRSVAQHYIDIDPSLNLAVFAAQAMDGSPPPSARVVGDAAGITAIFTRVFNQSLVTNQKSYLEAIREARPEIEALIGESLF